MADEFALTFDCGRQHRLLVVPALFDEANRLRRFTVEAMRAFDALGIDTMLPDLPGCNESAQPLAAQDLRTWREAMAGAAGHFRATHILAMRGGALVAPAPRGWAFAPTAGAAILRQMVRARVLASREAGCEEISSELLARGETEGIDLAGHALGAGMVTSLLAATPAELQAISQGDIGGPSLWLRAEPGEDIAQSQALANLVAQRLTA